MKHKMTPWQRCQHALEIGSMYTPGMTIDAVCFCARAAIATASLVCRDAYIVGDATRDKIKLKGMCRQARYVYRMKPGGEL